MKFDEIFVTKKIIMSPIFQMHHDTNQAQHRPPTEDLASGSSSSGSGSGGSSSGGGTIKEPHKSKKIEVSRRRRQSSAKSSSSSSSSVAASGKVDNAKDNDSEIVYEMRLVDNVIRSFRSVKVFRDNQEKINHMHFSQDGQLLITSADDDQIIIYDCERGTQKRTLNSKK